MYWTLQDMGDLWGQGGAKGLKHMSDLDSD